MRALQPAGVANDQPWSVKTAAELDAIEFPDPGWLIEGMWPGDSYGVLAAEAKAGKTWLSLDLLVSAATGTEFLGTFGTGDPGNVLMYHGEGAERLLQRRLRAVTNERGVAMPETLHYACFAPDLTDDEHLARIEADLQRLRPRLVVLDPLYLSMGGKNMASLTEVGPTLRAIQVLCEAVGAALVIVHHFNQTGHGTGARRMSGAGPEEWGRVLFSVSVRSEKDGPVAGSTVANLSVEVKGSEVPAQRFDVERTVWTEDPESLTAPMHYTATCDGLGSALGRTHVGATGRVLAVLRDTQSHEPLSVRELLTAVNEDGARELSERAIQDACKHLVDEGEIERVKGEGHAHRFTLPVKAQPA